MAFPKIKAKLVSSALAQFAIAVLAQLDCLVHANCPLPLSAIAKERTEREVRLDVANVLAHHGDQFIDSSVSIALEQQVYSLDVGPRMSGGSA